MIEAQQFIDEARALIGVKWRHQGRTKHGVDCIGLAFLAARNAGLDLATVGVRDQKVYGRAADPKLLKRVEECCMPSQSPVAGSLLFFQFYADKHPRHFGIFTERGTVIHADAKRGAVIEHGHRAHWVKWTHSVWLLPGVAYE